jgi:hypothetical protein
MMEDGYGMIKIYLRTIHRSYCLHVSRIAQLMDQNVSETHPLEFRWKSDTPPLSEGTSLKTARLLEHHVFGFAIGGLLQYPKNIIPPFMFQHFALIPTEKEQNNGGQSGDFVS